MKNNSLLLLKTLLLSTSRMNAYRYHTESKKRKKIIAGIAGAGILYAVLMLYSVFVCIGFGQYGMIQAAPLMCALVISVLSFVLTFFKTNGYLFNFKEYDMLMSLPFEARTVAGCKFLYMYIKSLGWYVSISAAMLAGYGYYAHPPIWVYPIWLLLSLFLPIVPMLAAAFLGFLIAKISAGFKKTKAIQIVLTFAFVLFCFSIRFLVEDMFRNNKVEATLEKTNALTDNIATYYIPAKWFAAVLTHAQWWKGLLLIGVSVVLFLLVFFIVGKSYTRINSALKSHVAAKNYQMRAQKSRTVVQAIAFKEFKRLTGSTNYMVNGAMGEILAVLTALIALIVGFDKIIALVMHGAPITAAMLQPAIPFIVYFFIGMMATTACSPSLEGKNFWIVQSLPLERKTLYQGKMLFNLYLTLPFMALSTLCFCLSAKVSPLNTVLYLVLGAALCAFSTAHGCVCGIKHMRLDWENEMEVIKQGAAVTIYLLPNMFVTMLVTVASVVAGKHIHHSLLAGVSTVLIGALALLQYLHVMHLCKNAK